MPPNTDIGSGRVGRRIAIKHSQPRRVFRMDCRADAASTRACRRIPHATTHQRGGSGGVSYAMTAPPASGASTFFHLHTHTHPGTQVQTIQSPWRVSAANARQLGMPVMRKTGDAQSLNVNAVSKTTVHKIPILASHVTTQVQRICTHTYTQIR